MSEMPRLLLASVILAASGLLLASPSYGDVLLKAADWQMNETFGLRSSPRKL